MLLVILAGVYYSLKWLGPKIADYLAAQTAALGEIKTSQAVNQAAINSSTVAVQTDVRASQTNILARLDLSEARILAEIRADHVQDRAK